MVRHSVNSSRLRAWYNPLHVRSGKTEAMAAALGSGVFHDGCDLFFLVPPFDEDPSFWSI
jgi:hypothetical protein